MKIRVLGCYGGADKHYRLTSFLINDTFVVDTGALVDALTFDEQRKITDIFISHIHLDHTGGLPIFIDNIFGFIDKPINIYGNPTTIRQLKTHIMNDVCWPDFATLPSPEAPTVRYIEIPDGGTFTVGDLQVETVRVDHLVETTGCIVTENGKNWIYPSDTGNTEKIWERVNSLPDPRLLFLECSFPNRFEKLAGEAKHLTPNGVARQLAKTNRAIPTRIYHCKPNFIDEIKQELIEIHHPDLDMLKQDHTYTI